MRTRRGAGAMEFALVVGLELIILIGVFELSMAVHRAYIVERIAMEACRTGTRVMEGANPTGDQIEAAAVDYAEAALRAVDVACASGCTVSASWERLDEWQVLVVEIRQPWTPLTGILFTANRSLDARHVMLTQQQIIQ